MIECLRIFHGKHFIHRKLEPQNICSGRGKKSGSFYLIDYNNSKRYICPRTGNHIAKKGRVQADLWRPGDDNDVKKKKESIFISQRAFKGYE